MADAFRTSDEFDEQAHQLYNEGSYEDALALLREGLSIYPNAVELHIGTAYAHLAREDYAWARRSFETAVGLDPDNEDALAGLGEALLKLGDRAGALRAYERIVALGFREDLELMLQPAAPASVRACWRRRIATSSWRWRPTVNRRRRPPAWAMPHIAWAMTRVRSSGSAARSSWSRSTPRRGSTSPTCSTTGARAKPRCTISSAPSRTITTTKLGLWRCIELKKTIYRLPDDDLELSPWYSRLGEVAGEPDAIDMLLAEIEALQPDGTVRDPHQLELFGTLLTELQAMQKRPGGDTHHVSTLAGHSFRGSWEEILLQMRDADPEWAGATLTEFMAGLARRGRTETGIVIPQTDAEAFIRGSSEAGVLRILH